MQTAEMKKDYAVAVLDPAGNVTALVLSDVPAAERAQVAARLLRLPELHIEQAAFLTAPRCGGEIRLEMMGGEFCGNALRCAGFYHALRTGAQGKTCVFAEISGAEGVQIGTRFVVTEEAQVHENYKECILKARDIDSRVTGRSTGHPVRALRNKMTKEYLEKEQAGATFEELEHLTLGGLRRAVVDGDVQSGSVMAGQIAGMIKEKLTCQEVIQKLVSQTDELIGGKGFYE